jgi:hypothetical protein
MIGVALVDIDNRRGLIGKPHQLLPTDLGGLPDGVELRVGDSTAMVRCLVLPRRPEGAESFSEDELASFVTRDAVGRAARCVP